MARLGVYSAPVEVLDLERDIYRLRWIRDLASELDARNVSERVECGDDRLCELQTLIWYCQMAANHKMREYLGKAAGAKIRV